MIAKSLTAALIAALLPITLLASYLPDGYISGQSGPSYQIGPYQPCRPIPKGPPRTKTCVVKANGNGADDSQNILDALHDCNNGGHVIFTKDEKYIIGTALDMTFLDHIDIGNYPVVPSMTFIDLFHRYPRLHSIHQRHQLLASTRLLPDFPECDNLLPTRRI